MNAIDKGAALIISSLCIAIAIVAARSDQAGAGVLRISPENQSSPPLSTPIRIEFSQPMQARSVPPHFSIEPDVSGNSRWDGNTFVFSPIKRLKPGQHYTVTLKAGSVSQLGRIVTTDLQWSFVPRGPGVLYLKPEENNTNSLWYTDASGEQPRLVLRPSHSVDSFSPSPDGSKIVVSLIGDGQSAELWIIDRDGGNAKQISSCHPDYCGQPGWSPSGRTIAFERHSASSGTEDSGSRIWMYDADTAAAEPLLQDSQELGFDAVWNGDGSQLAYFDPGRPAIRVVDIVSGKVINLASQMGQTGTFSSDGLSIVFTDVRPVGGQFYPYLWEATLDPDRQAAPLAMSTEEDQFPAWSPVADLLAFARRRIDRSEGMGLQLMLLHGANGLLEQITHDRNLNSTSFKWSPDGVFILMERFPLGTENATSQLWIYELSSRSLIKIADGSGGEWIP